MSDRHIHAMICSWCKRIKDPRSGAWIEPPVDSEDNYVHPGLRSHGLCSECYSEIVGEFMGDDRSQATASLVELPPRS
jgi:hypothetical protein